MSLPAITLLIPSSKREAEAKAKSTQTSHFLLFCHFLNDVKAGAYFKCGHFNCWADIPDLSVGEADRDPQGQVDPPQFPPAPSA